MKADDKKTVQLTDRKILVVGLARSGTAAANFLINRGARVTVTDLKSESGLTAALEHLSSPVQLSLGGHHLQDFISADTIVLSPGVPRSIPELQQAASAGVEIMSEVELAYRFLQGPFVGVTGSNGKTTTTTLIGAILEKAGKRHVVAGNIGTPLTSLIDDSSINRKETIFVVELSSFQLETISQLRCKIALLLNITPDHMDRYPSFEAYCSAKGRIFQNQTIQDFAIINSDDPNTHAVAANVRSRVLPFSSSRKLAEGAYLEQGNIIISWDGQCSPILALEDIRLKGAHNIENTLAASAAAFFLGVSLASVKNTVREFKGVHHRLEWVGNLRGVDFYNDSKATNVESAIRAIQSFETPLTLIMGGLDKGTDFSPLRKAISNNVLRVILLGRASEKLASTLQGLVEIERTASMEEAVHRAFQLAPAGSVVLLSPACASFDMFQDYEERGRVFTQLVQALNTNGKDVGSL